MLDAAFIRDNLDAVKANCVNRNVKADVDRVVQLDDDRKRLVQQTQLLQQRANEVSKLIPKEKDAAKKQELIAEGKALREEVAALEKQLKQVEADLHAVLHDHPEHDASRRPGRHRPATTTRSSRNGASRGKFDFTPKDHVALAESAATWSISRPGRAVAGQKFYFLKNEAVLLELALVQYAMHTLLKHGYTPIITPDLARVDVLEGIGFMPRDPDPRNGRSTPSPTPTCA